MIKTSRAELIESNAHALVNTVNTVGVMGKGVALKFKEKFPENYEKYRSACKRNQIKIGKMFFVKVEQAQRDFLAHPVEPNTTTRNPKWIINFPTKEHWRSPSRIEWIETGLLDLKRGIKERKEIRSVAIPQLGCGNGGLDWKKVEPLICDAFKDLVEVDVTIHIYQETVIE